MNDKNVRFRCSLLITALLILFSIILISCSWQGDFLNTTGAGRISIKVEIDEKANQNSPIAFDLLVFTDKDLLNKVLGFDSKKWFKEREQFKNDYLSGGIFYYQGWEFAPGQKVPDMQFPTYWKAIGAIIFVNYLTPGPHRYRVNPYKDFSVHFKETKIVVKQAK